MKTIIFIEDNEDIRELYSLMMTRFGHKVVSFENYKQSEDYLKNNYADLIITDYYLPGTNGDGVVAMARQHEQTCPVICLTGAPEDVKPGLYDAVLAKPIGAEALELSIEMYTSGLVAA